ncbi:thiol-disulfide isomerase [Mucilaginibacter sp. PPCGB 2223]|uniref:thioredoxin family protein n=1 Tax=Mucilaginibacter sp. PPCGB 2223 TaxID=1886027 RepID=UPI0008263426|nr:thioredoxin family protein [Mucilaginibacter sp. PPCGB 2223]OCX53232.1 thiol-disulfide isomerase [Mucilaginibacter sp. PPCGB 2223]
MKFLSMLFLFLLIAIKPVTWLGDINTATAEAVKSKELIMINFSGSDWCGPCIRLRKEILESDVFTGYAADHLVLVRADFPRQKKNQLDKEQVKRNEALADKYNPEGKFPFTLLIDAQGKILKTWDGFPNESPEQFTAQVRSFEK